MNTYDRVIFRTWKGKFGGVVAILPDQEANPGRVVTYEHVGQHGEGDYNLLLRATRPSTLDERSPLQKELKDIGYNPLAVKRLARPRRRR